MQRTTEFIVLLPPGATELRMQLRRPAAFWHGLPARDSARPTEIRGHHYRHVWGEWLGAACAACAGWRVGGGVNVGVGGHARARARGRVCLYLCVLKLARMCWCSRSRVARMRACVFVFM